MLKIVFLLSFISLAGAQALPSPQGFYSKGHILFAQSLPLEGEGFMRLFADRDRGWGSHTMLDLIQKTALEMNQNFPMRDRLQVGDIAQMTGGQMTRHNSHQNGLDVDLTYYRTNGVEQAPDIFDEFHEMMVIDGKISPNFDHERNWELLKTLHRNGKVQRVFVDVVIKKELCAYSASISEDLEHVEVLRSLRPYDDHYDHLHVRLRCPETAANCIAQEETPVGSGCDAL